MFAKERAGHFMSLQVCKRDENMSVRVIHAVREEDRGLCSTCVYEDEPADGHRCTACLKVFYGCDTVSEGANKIVNEGYWEEKKDD